VKHGVITVISLLVSVSIWPPASGLAAVDLAHDAAAGMVTNASTNARGLLHIAKQHDGDSDEGEEQGEHRNHYRHGKHHQQFCGPYFKSSSVGYFRDYYSRDDYANLPPGLRKHVLKTGHLPPGLEKKYERTGQLPPGLQKRFECGQTLSRDYSPYLYPVPDVAYERVGPLPPDSKLYLYGNDLILLNDHTKAIIDMLRGAY
jgi:Ni/Co efflux regulator RcnB